LKVNKCFNENALTIKPDGSVYPCLLTPALYLGSLDELPISLIVDGVCNNSFFNGLEKNGFEWLINLIKENKLPINLKNSYVNLCDVCHTLFEKKEYLKLYNSAISGISPTYWVGEYAKS
jgi:hypothetical protein